MIGPGLQDYTRIDQDLTKITGLQDYARIRQDRIRGEEDWKMEDWKIGRLEGWKRGRRTALGECLLLLKGKK